MTIEMSRAARDADTLARKVMMQKGCAFPTDEAFSLERSWFVKIYLPFL